MIEDKFETQKVTGDPEEATAIMRCKQCNTVFDVHMAILRPLNCCFDLGKSLTVICPNCHIEAMTTEHESKVAALELQAKSLRTRINETIARIGALFRVKGVGDWKEMAMAIMCVRCGHNFVANIVRGINAHWQPGQMAIKCPMCNTTEVTDKAKALERLEIVHAITQLRDIDAELDKLKKGGPNAGSETVQTPL